MGLDAYVRVTTKEVPDGIDEIEDLWYGRKENEIHGWMQRQSGVAAEDFNCERLPLSLQMLDALEEACNTNSLEHTAGFFFGSPNYVEEVKEAVSELVRVSRAAIAEGKEPYYFSWW